MCKKKYLLFIGVILTFIASVWSMFQSLMSAYAEGPLVSGRIHVYGVSFLNCFGLQGVLIVTSPFLLMLLICLNLRKKHKTWLCFGLIISAVLAYAKSCLNAKQWLTTMVGPEVQYYAASFAFPCLMVVLAALVLLCIQYYDEDDICEEWEDNYDSDM